MKTQKEITEEGVGYIIKSLSKHIRIVEITQNSWEEENLLLLTTLKDKQIKKVLAPLLKEERDCEDGSVIYANDDMAQILSEKYPNDIVIYYQTPDELVL
jgi:hypothetical protein